MNEWMNLFVSNSHFSRIQHSNIQCWQDLKECQAFANRCPQNGPV